MKKLALLITASILLSFSAHAADFKTVDEAVKKLSTYTVADIDGDVKRLAEKKALKIDEMFNDLTSAANLLEKAKITEDIAYEMERVSLLTFLHDPTTYAVDLILEDYQKNKALFEKAAKKLHNTDRKLILETLKSKDDSSKKGSG